MNLEDAHEIADSIERAIAEKWPRAEAIVHCDPVKVS